MKKNKLLAVLVAATLILAATVAALAYALHAQNVNHEAEIASYDAQIQGLENRIEALQFQIPSAGESCEDIVFFSLSAKVYYASEDALASRDSVGCLDQFHLELDEKGSLYYYSKELSIAGVEYVAEHDVTTADGKMSAKIYSLPGGLYVVQDAAEG